MYQTYKETSFRGDTLKLINLMNSLIADYMAQGFVLSVRQLYYQLVARDLIPNTEQSYKRVASIINDARLAGYMDWEAIEDRGRDVEMRTRWNSGADIVNAAANSFHMDMWDSQTTRLFVVVEKAALAGVLSGVCAKWDVPLLAARGYPSVSVLREMALGHLVPAIQHGQGYRVLHLGDHDPSGIDMTRDLSERLSMFIQPEVDEWDMDMFEVSRIALTMEQIKKKNPPPNPAKQTDARFDEYRRKFGNKSWELDALEPEFLVSLVEAHIQDAIDEDRWEERRSQVEAIRKRLNKVAKEFA